MLSLPSPIVYLRTNNKVHVSCLLFLTESLTSSRNKIYRQDHSLCNEGLCFWVRQHKPKADESPAKMVGPNFTSKHEVHCLQHFFHWAETFSKALCYHLLNMLDLDKIAKLSAASSLCAIIKILKQRFKLADGNATVVVRIYQFGEAPPFVRRKADGAISCQDATKLNSDTGRCHTIMARMPPTQPGTQKRIASFAHLFQRKTIAPLQVQAPEAAQDGLIVQAELLFDILDCLGFFLLRPFPCGRIFEVIVAHHVMEQAPDLHQVNGPLLESHPRLWRAMVSNGKRTAHAHARTHARTHTHAHTQARKNKGEKAPHRRVPKQCAAHASAGTPAREKC